MTRQYIEQRVAEIGAMRDDEGQHAAEDDLRNEVLQHLADNGCELAAAVLKTNDLDFSRWFA